MSLEELQKLEREALMPTYARNPVEFVRGEGTRLWDSEGNEYLDFLTGISVVQLGHSHPALVAAVRAQAERLMHVGNLYYSEPGVRLAARLSELALGGKAFFTNSGAEAVECALKLARKQKRGGDVVVLEKGFHGRTFGALSATPQEPKQAPFAPLVPGFRVAPRDSTDLPVDERTAAVLVEPIQGESGILPVDPGVLRAAREACDAHGALLIFDEIQCGMGRTGDLWAWQGLGVRPDVMTVAKGLGGGLPIGACLAGPAHADVLRAGDHGSTFAGAPVAAAAGLATLDVIDDPELMRRARELGARFSSSLAELGDVAEVRGRGLMVGATLAEGLDAKEVAGSALEAGLVINVPGPGMLRFLPPLVIGDDDVDAAVNVMRDVLS